MADDNKKEKGKQGQEEQPDPHDADQQAQASLVDPEKRNYRNMVNQFVEQINQVEAMIGQLQGFLLQIKGVTPYHLTIHINDSMHNLTGASKQMGWSRDQILKVLGIKEDTERPGDPRTSYFIRQTETFPKEQYEVRQSGETSPVHVSRCPKTGDYSCLTDEKVGKGKTNRYVEAVKHWRYQGRPKVVEYDQDPDVETTSSGVPADSKLGGGGYERPGFWGTHQPVGYPDARVGEGQEPIVVKSIMESHDFHLLGNSLYVSGDNKHFVFVDSETRDWRHRTVAPGLSINGTGLKSLSEHLDTLSRLQEKVSSKLAS